ncbi:MAG: hypothetical protein LBO07_07630 [Coriobacteriales bacterium]|nr:hypothetical protein [Coriobacteriales bacterium]
MIIGAAAIVLVAIIVGILIYISMPTASVVTDEIVVKDNVSAITSEDDAEKQPAEVTDDGLIFDVDPQYPNGEVLVAGIIDAAPNGFIRKVVDTSQEDGKYIVRTEPAVLTDVFERAHIAKSFALTEEGAVEIDPGSIQDTGAPSPASIDNEAPPLQTAGYSYSAATAQPMTAALDEKIPGATFIQEFGFEPIEGIAVEGSVEFTVWIDLKLDIEGSDVIFELVANDRIGGSVSLICSAGVTEEFEKVLRSFNLPKIQFLIAIVPVVITNELQVSVEGEAHLQGVFEVSFENETESSLGFRYDSRSGIEEVRETKRPQKEMEWKTTAKAVGGASVGGYLHLVTKLYDSTGTDIAIGVVGSAEGELSVSAAKSADGLNYAGSLDLKIAPVVSGGVVVAVPIIDHVLLEAELFEFEFEPFWSWHWDSGDDWKQQLEDLKTTSAAQLVGDWTTNPDAPYVPFSELEQHPEAVRNTKYLNVSQNGLVNPWHNGQSDVPDTYICTSAEDIEGKTVFHFVYYANGNYSGSYALDDAEFVHPDYDLETHASTNGMPITYFADLWFDLTYDSAANTIICVATGDGYIDDILNGIYYRKSEATAEQPADNNTEAGEAAAPAANSTDADIVGSWSWSAPRPGFGDMYTMWQINEDGTAVHGDSVSGLTWYYSWTKTNASNESGQPLYSFTLTDTDSADKDSRAQLILYLDTSTGKLHDGEQEYTRDG